MRTTQAIPPERWTMKKIGGSCSTYDVFMSDEGVVISAQRLYDYMTKQESGTRDLFLKSSGYQMVENVKW